MLHVRRLPWSAALFTALLSASACSGPPMQEGPVRIGVIVSLTGDLGAVGDHLTKAVQLAAREANAAGGLLDGRPVEIIVRDDQTEPEIAEAAARELIEQEGVVGIVGSLASSASLRVAEVAYAAQVPQVSCCSTSSALTTAQPETDRYLFRTVPSDLLQASIIAEQADRALMCSRLAILHLDDAYGQPFGDSIRANFEANSATGSVVIQVAFPPGRPSYADQVRMVADANPDCIALVAYPDSGGFILRDWHALSTRPTVTWIGTDGIRDPGLATAAGDRSVVDGVMGTAPIIAPTTQTYNDFAANYNASFGAETGIFGGNEYDAAVLMMLAIEAAGSTDGTAVRDALFRVSRDDSGSDPFVGAGEIPRGLMRIRSGSDIDYVGASGDVDFDGFGDIVTDYEIWRYDAARDSFVRDSVVRASEINP